MQRQNLANIVVEISRMQGELNRLVGVDSEKLAVAVEPKDKAEAQEWYFRFLQQFAGEAMEARDNFYHKWWSKEVRDGTVELYTVRSREKIVVELIDMLHFFVSAIQCAGFPPAWGTLWEAPAGAVIATDAGAYSALLVITSVALSKKPDLHSVAVLFRALFHYFELTPEKIFDVYKKKHAANVRRQEEGYSVNTKTETDNEQIEAEIKEEKI